MRVEDIRLEEDDDLKAEIRRLARKGRFKRRFFTTLLVCLLLAGVLLVSLYVGGSRARQESAEEIEQLRTRILEQEEQIQVLKDTPIVVNPVAPEINLDIVYHEMRELAQLVTAEYLFTDVAKFSDSRQIKNWSIPLTEKSFILKWDGAVKAGIELEDVEFDVNREEFTITVYLPAAKIMSYEIDYDTVEVLESKDSVFNKITLQDRIQFDAQTEDAMIERAIENGILGIAENNAAAAIEKLLSAIKEIDESYRFEFILEE